MIVLWVTLNVMRWAGIAFAFYLIVRGIDAWIGSLRK